MIGPQGGSTAPNLICAASLTVSVELSVGIDEYLVFHQTGWLLE